MKYQWLKEYEKLSCKKSGRIPVRNRVFVGQRYLWCLLCEKYSTGVKCVVVKYWFVCRYTDVILQLPTTEYQSTLHRRYSLHRQKFISIHAVAAVQRFLTKTLNIYRMSWLKLSLKQVFNKSLTFSTPILIKCFNFQIHWKDPVTPKPISKY